MCLAQSVNTYHRALALGDLSRQALNQWNNKSFSKEDLKTDLFLPLALDLFKAFHNQGFLFKESYQVVSSTLFNYLLHRIESTPKLGKNSLLSVLFNHYPLHILSLFKKNNHSKQPLNFITYLTLGPQDLHDLHISTDAQHLKSFLDKMKSLSHPSLKPFKNILNDQQAFSNQLKEQFAHLQATFKEDIQQTKKDPLFKLKQVITCIPEDKKIPVVKSILKLAFWVLSLHKVSGKDNAFEKYGLFIYLGIDIFPSETRAFPKSIKEIKQIKIEPPTVKNIFRLSGHLLISMSKAHKIYLATLLHFAWEISADVVEMFVNKELVEKHIALRYFLGKPYSSSEKK